MAGDGDTEGGFRALKRTLTRSPCLPLRGPLWDRMHGLAMLAFCAMDMGRLTDALEAAEEALDSHLVILGHDNYFSASLMVLYSECLVQCGHFHLGFRWLQEAVVSALNMNRSAKFCCDTVSLLDDMESVLYELIRDNKGRFFVLDTLEAFARKCGHPICSLFDSYSAGRAPAVRLRVDQMKSIKGSVLSVSGTII